VCSHEYRPTYSPSGAAVVALTAVGCANTPVERQDTASSAWVELRDAMVATRGQIEQTLASLNELTGASPNDLRDAYQQYTKNADKIAQQALTVDKESRQMRKRSDEWLAGWRKSQKDINNAELKAVGEKRRAQALERFQNIDGSFAAAREAFAPFIANLQEVKKVVGNDLTPKGVASDTAVVRNANQSGAAAARALDVTITDLHALTQTLAPSATADASYAIARC
jgi:hypothetical protein